MLTSEYSGTFPHIYVFKKIENVLLLNIKVKIEYHKHVLREKRTDNKIVKKVASETNKYLSKTRT